MLFVLHLVRGHSLTAVILLALVPFVRQNLLIVSLILAGVLVARTRHWWLLLPYTAVLGLPLYHNCATRASSGFSWRTAGRCSVWRAVRWTT